MKFCLRSHTRKCRGGSKRGKPPFVRVDKRYYCAHVDCLPPTTASPPKLVANSKVTPGENQVREKGIFKVKPFIGPPTPFTVGGNQLISHPYFP
jgi:hypothetical protein